MLRLTVRSLCIYVRQILVLFVQSFSGYTEILDPDGKGEICFTQFCKAVKQILELEGFGVFMLMLNTLQVSLA